MSLTVLRKMLQSCCFVCVKYEWVGWVQVMPSRPFYFQARPWDKKTSSHSKPHYERTYQWIFDWLGFISRSLNVLQTWALPSASAAGKEDQWIELEYILFFYIERRLIKSYLLYILEKSLLTIHIKYCNRSWDMKLELKFILVAQGCFLYREW